jgi:hypothetical protein
MDSDLAVWEAANQMMRMYPADPVWAAAALSHAALEIDDMANYQHWLLVSCAILKLQQARATTSPAPSVQQQRDCA